jgi:hypothetical protein
VETIKELRKICQRPDCTQRSVSIYFTKLLLYTKISPNQVTFIDDIFGISGAFLFFVSSNWAFVIGGILLQFFEIFDCVDGEIARYLKVKGVLNRSIAEENRTEFLQDIIHPILHPLMFLGLGFGLFRLYPNLLILILSFAAALGMSLDTYVNVLREKILGASGLQASRVYKQMNDGAKGFASKIPLGKQILEFIVFLTPVPGVITLLMVAPILDMILLPSPIYIMGFPLDFKIAVLILYAIVQQFLWILNARFSVKSIVDNYEH